MSSTEWTREAPTVPGYYWWSDAIEDGRDWPIVVQVESGGNVAVCGDRTRGDVADGGEWSGPIPTPL